MNLILLAIGIILLASVSCILLIGMMKRSKSGIVMLYQDSCPHCTTLKPIILEASSKTGIPVMMWEANERIDFCKNNNIDRVPMVLEVSGDNILRRYTGDQDLSSLIEFLQR